jgi:ABC-type xylose transport system permease subunit
VSWPGSFSRAPHCRSPYLSLGAGILAGLNNAFWIAWVGLPSLAVTLAGLIGYRGIARILLEDRAIGGFPDWFNTLGQQGLIGPLTAAISIFFVLFVFFASCTARFGRPTQARATFRRRAIRACGSGDQGELVRWLGGLAPAGVPCAPIGTGARRHGEG